MEFNKKDYINIIKEIEIDKGNITKNKESGKIEINIIGRQMQKSSNQISLKSIYDLVVNLQENTKENFNSINKRLDLIEQDIVSLKNNINLIQQDVKKIKLLPTIAKELKWM